VTRIVDTHFHLQDLERYAYPWLDPGSTPPNVFGENFGRLRRSYRIEDYLADVSGLGVMKAVHVENGVNVADSVAETLWLQSIADQTGFPHAIVAQVPLHEPGSTEMIEAHTQAKNLRGVRHILNWHADPRLRFAPAPDLLASADWRRGFSLLERHDLSFDLQIYPHQLAEAFDLARAFPDTQIILCHLGMPIERSSDELMDWESAMRKFGRAENVAVKLLGFALGQGGWTLETMRPLVLKIVEIFGVDRCTFGSNFPVDGLYSTYRALVETFEKVMADFSAAEAERLLAANAECVYRI
jgi:predicted TIM-barrel fold metal-dependent hydrolase